MLIEFRGAKVEMNDEGEKEYEDRGPIWINPNVLAGYYEHTLLVNGHKIRVMEEIPEIQRKLAGEKTEENPHSELLSEMRLG